MLPIFSQGSWKKILPFTFLILAILACSISPAVPSVPTVSATAQARLTPMSSRELEKIPMQVGYGFRGPFYELYFTDPTNPAAGNEEGGPDKPLVAAINDSRISVDVAMYSLSLNSVKNALINAYKRGVQVRTVMESDNMNDSAPQALIAAGIPMIGDRREGLMHNKFVIIDRSEVWTGSMNYTYSGTYQDNNNLVRIISDKVAQDYTVEFEEMFKNDFFGPDVVAATPFPQLIVDGTAMEVYFSPDDHVARRIATLLRGAQKSIYFMAYSFTADDFADILRQKAHDGLQIGGVMDADMVKSNAGNEFDSLTKAGLSVYLDGNPGLMHHKVFIIDEDTVITGSYNFTASAERKNDENVVVFHDPLIASAYIAEYQRVLAVAQAAKSKP